MEWDYDYDYRTLCDLYEKWQQENDEEIQYQRILNQSSGN